MCERLDSSRMPDVFREENKNDNSITAVRYLLALAVAVAHVNYLTGGSVMFPITSYQGVCGFFTISGFLIIKSFHHSEGKIGRYLFNRAVRILPSYFVVVIIATFALAGISTMPAGSYFSSGHTWRYLLANLSFMNFIEPSLPGVFDANDVTSAVNGSLWTMKIEWALYLSVPVAAWLIWRRNRRPWVVISAFCLFSVGYRWGLWTLYQRTGEQIYEILSRQFFGQLTFFYLGVFLYFYYGKLRRRLPLIGAVALCIAVGALFIGRDSDLYRFVVDPLVLSAIVLSSGLAGRWGCIASRFTDCSYELYLFHFPVIQVFVNLCPDMAPTRIFFFAMGSTLVLAYLTARFVSLPLRRWLKSL